MKILFLIDNLGSGGAQRQLVTIVPLLKQRGFEPEVLCYWEQDFFAPILEKENITIHWKIEPNFIKRIWKVRQFIRNGNFKAVISFLDTPNFLNCIAAIGGKKWKVITGERSANEAFFHSQRGKFFAWFQRYSDVIVCNSHNAEIMWKKHYPKYSNKLTTIYNTVSIDAPKIRYSPLRDGKVHIVIAATYRYIKNVKGLIKSLSLLSSHEKAILKVDWYGRIVRENGISVFEAANKMILENSLQDVISLNENTKEIVSKMAESDFIGLFSKYEGLPNAICEGMILGKPIIMTRVSDFNKLVDSSNGFLCDWDNMESIKEAIASALKLTQEILGLMGEASRIKSNKLFSSKILIKKWEDIIN